MSIGSEIKQRWLDALESGEYPKGKNILAEADPSEPGYISAFCCLGVLHHIEDDRPWVLDKRGHCYVVNTQRGVSNVYDLEYYQSLGIPFFSIGELMNLNDHNDTWEPAIKYIKENL